jgi:hypothetical protein
MHLKRFRSLLSHAEKKLTDDNFSIFTWGYETSDCGTVACLGGHATTIPSFRKAGLMDNSYMPMLDDRGHRYHGFAALQRFFSLTEKQTNSLFAHKGYKHLPVTKDMVIGKMRRMLAAVVKKRAAKVGR